MQQSGDRGEHTRRKLLDKSIELINLLDQTQGNLVLRWNAWRGPEQLREIGLPALYCSIALFFLVLFALESLLRGKPGHAAILTGFALMTVPSYLYLRISNDTHTTNTIIVLLLAMLCLFLFYTGGIQGTGPLWYYVFPLFSLFVKRLWVGLIWVILLFGVTVLLLWLPVAGFDPAMYSNAFISRFLAVYIAVSLMAFFYAFVRAGMELEINSSIRNFRNMANMDDLTHLPNRRRMKEVLYQEISRTRRNRGIFCLVILDIDHFKQINDSYGHECGDVVLRAIPSVFRQILRTQDIYSRWGGEEFLIMLPDSTLKGAKIVAERLRLAFEQQTITYGSHTIHITASLGVTQFSDTDNLDDCLRRADGNLYAAKTAGRNRVIAR